MKYKNFSATFYYAQCDDMISVNVANEQTEPRHYLMLFFALWLRFKQICGTFKNNVLAKGYIKRDIQSLSLRCVDKLVKIIPLELIFTELPCSFMTVSSEIKCVQLLVNCLED